MWGGAPLGHAALLLGGWLWEGLSEVSEQLWPRQTGPVSGELGGTLLCSDPLSLSLELSASLPTYWHIHQVLGTQLAPGRVLLPGPPPCFLPCSLTNYLSLLPAIHLTLVLFGPSVIVFG